MNEQGVNLAETQILACKAMEPYKVCVKFLDGVEGVVDLSDLLLKEVFAEAWDTEEKFQQVRIDPIIRTLTWGEGEDVVDVNRVSLKKEVLESKKNRR